ncbi:MAG TPA: DUF2383 domain-containing protein [Planctomycetota bacterium]|nr:DUF2383 domain-containing protein [Planctomycetota bacterium]
MDTTGYGGAEGKGLVRADIEESYWRASWQTRPYFRDDYTYDDFAPAYRTGWEGYSRYGASGGSFDAYESALRKDYENNRGTSRLRWEEARDAIRDAWDRVKQGLGMAGQQPRHASTSLGGADIADRDEGASYMAEKPGADHVYQSGQGGGGFNYGYGGIGGVYGGEAHGVDKSIHYLNSFLRGEISAVETYRQAIQKIGGAYPQLAECMMSHERRVGMLQDKIRSLGGEPAVGSGMWGAWAKVVQGTADLFGERSAISALETGEDHGRNDYRRELENLDEEVRSWVERELIPLEERTHAVLSELKHAHV